MLSKKGMIASFCLSDASTVTMGLEAEIIVDQSTSSQAIFILANALTRVGLLSLPPGLSYAGWVVGLGSIIVPALVTLYASSLFLKCVDVYNCLANFVDIAYCR